MPFDIYGQLKLYVYRVVCVTPNGPRQMAGKHRQIKQKQNRMQLARATATTVAAGQLLKVLSGKPHKHTHTHR